MGVEAWQKQTFPVRMRKSDSQDWKATKSNISIPFYNNLSRWPARLSCLCATRDKKHSFCRQSVFETSDHYK